MSAHADTVMPHEVFVGALVWWMHVPRGGYGFAMAIPARVTLLSLDGTRAVIATQRRDGREMRRRVLTKSLRWRPDARLRGTCGGPRVDLEAGQGIRTLDFNLGKGGAPERNASVSSDFPERDDGG